MRYRLNLALAFASTLVGGFGARVQTLTSPSYYSITLGEDKPNVAYDIGVPPLVEGFAWFSADHHSPEGLYATGSAAEPAFEVLKPHNDYKAFDDWYYDGRQPNGNVIVTFTESGRVKSIRCKALAVTPGACEPAFGINIGDTKEDVRGMLGNPSMTLKDEQTSTFIYSDLKLIIDFAANHEVDALTVGTY
jgi:hypothetical protein